MDEQLTIASAVRKIADIDALIERAPAMAMDIVSMLEAERKELVNYVAEHSKGLGE